MEEAIFSDCQSLIAKFAQSGSPSFASFCALWKQMSFQHLFTAQSNSTELQQTTATLFHVAKCILCKNGLLADFGHNMYLPTSAAQTELLQRIGGLYVMYAIYFKQPLEQFTKIEVSLKTWQSFKRFIEIILPADAPEYDEARYTFWKLYQSQAFRFTALDYCVGLESLVDFDNLDKSDSNANASYESRDNLTHKLHNFVGIKQTLPALVALEEGYNEMKESLTKIHKLDKKSLPPTKIFQNIRDRLKHIESMLNETTESSQNQIETKSQRRALKDKAYGNKTDESPNELPSPSPKKNRICRMSARTIFAQELPEDINEDLGVNVRNEELESMDDDNDDVEEEQLL